MEASDILIIVGSIIRPKRMEAVSTLMPLPPKVSRTKGTNITSPKNPYTTEGIPAMRLVAGFYLIQPRRTESGHEYCGQYADGNSYDESACGDIDRTDDHRQYAVKIVGRTPLGSKQEIEDSYLSDGRYSAGE